jgi:hypothetical protein
MKRSMAGVAKITGALALAGGVIMMAALPALAAGPTNEAYAASATGRIFAPPIGRATFPTGIHVVTLPHANIPGLLTTGFVIDRAGPTSASSNVAAVRARLTKAITLSARTVSSSCIFHIRTGRVSGSTKITYGAVSAPFRTIPLPWYPAPNTTVSVPGVATITLNRQTTNPYNGTLTVTAIYVKLLHGKQTLTLATSVCNAAKLAPVPILPGKTLPMTLGGLGVLMIGGAGYRATRRSRFAAAA